MIYCAHGFLINFPPSVVMCNAPADVFVTSTLLQVFVPCLNVLNLRRSKLPSFRPVIFISSSTILFFYILLILDQVLLETLNLYRGLPSSLCMTIYCHCPSYISQRTLISLSCNVSLTLLIKNLNSELDRHLPFNAYTSGMLFGADESWNQSLSEIIKTKSSVACSLSTSCIFSTINCASPNIKQD